MHPHRPFLALALVGTLSGVLMLVWQVSRDMPAQTPASAPASPAAPPAVRPKLYLFTQPRCAPCAAMKVAMQDPQVQQALSRFDFQEVQARSPLGRQYNVASTPTLVAVGAGGVQVRAGAMTSDAILSWLAGVQEVDRGAFVAKSPDEAGPGGQFVAVDFPMEFCKHNVTSKGQGCCVFRSTDWMAHYLTVPQLYDLPEWLQKNGLAGGGYPGNWTERVNKISAERGLPVPEHIQLEGSKDTTVMELALKTGRPIGVDYDGHDGVFYSGRIAHMLCLVYLSGDNAAIRDNNNPTKILWMSRADFLQRWGGWAVILLSSRPPPPPHN